MSRFSQRQQSNKSWVKCIARSRKLILVSSAGMLSCAIAWHAAAETSRSPKETITAKFEAVKRHSVEEIASFYAPDATLNAPDMCAPRQGKAEVERTYQAIFAAFPHIQAELLEVVVEGEHVAARVLLKSTDPAMRFELSIANFFTVRDGLIIRDEGLFDTHGRPCSP